MKTICKELDLNFKTLENGVKTIIILLIVILGIFLTVSEILNQF
jgi:hypothetical protein